MQPATGQAMTYNMEWTTPGPMLTLHDCFTGSCTYLLFHRTTRFEYYYQRYYCRRFDKCPRMNHVALVEDLYAQLKEKGVVLEL